MKLRKNFRECPTCQHLEAWGRDQHPLDEFILCELENLKDRTDLVEEVDDDTAWKEEFGKICHEYVP